MKSVYFDNAATTLKKPNEVIRKTVKLIQSGCANAGRSGHFMSLRAAQMIYEVREIICDFLSFDRPQNIVFAHNATTALNQAIKGLIPHGAHVVTSTMEHNSVLRPLYSMRDEGKITLSFFSHRGDIESNIKSSIKKDTKAIVCSLTSNVTGEEIPIALLSSLRKELGLLVIVDASQLFAHDYINLERTPVDAFCTAGHKGAFAMQGVGFAVYDSTPLYTTIEGGSGFDSFSEQMPPSLPERLEAGTLSAIVIASLGYGLEFIRKIGVEEIQTKLREYDVRLYSILSEFPEIKQLAKGAHGIHSFVVGGQASSQTAYILEKNGFLVRSGFHCAPILHKEYGTTESGAVRISFSYFNTTKEIDKLYKTLKGMRLS